MFGLPRWVQKFGTANGFLAVPEFLRTGFEAATRYGATNVTRNLTYLNHAVI